MEFYSESYHLVVFGVEWSGDYYWMDDEDDGYVKLRTKSQK
jgi:hypothetical protein